MILETSRPGIGQFFPFRDILLFTSSSPSRKDQFAVLYFLQETVPGVFAKVDSSQFPSWRF